MQKKRKKKKMLSASAGATQPSKSRGYSPHTQFSMVCHSRHFLSTCEEAAVDDDDGGDGDDVAGPAAEVFITAEPRTED